jgi:hypothetical protein
MTVDQRPLNLLFDVRLETGLYGGVEHMIVGMVHGPSFLGGSKSLKLTRWRSVEDSPNAFLQSRTS